MDRTRRIAMQVLSRHPEAFGSDYEKNKRALDDLMVIPSKQLRNKIAGYIAKETKPDETDDENSSTIETRE